MKNAITYIICTAILFAFVYGIYYVAKSVSYAIFYEDMFQGTIREIVKMECLK